MTKSTLFVMALIMGTGVAGLAYLGYLYPPYQEPIVVHKIIMVVDPNTIPSIREIQQRLKDTGKPRYDPGKIDGRISLTGKTQEAWNNYTCDQYAIRAIEGR